MNAALRTSRVGYVVQTYPATTEQFIRREIDALARQGVPVDVFTLRSGGGCESGGRSMSFSWARVIFSSIFLAPILAARWEVAVSAWLALRRDYGPCALAANMVRGLFLARQIAKRRIDHLHCHFLTMPALLGYLVHELTGVSYSLSGHAKDVFNPEYGQSAIVFSEAERIYFCTESARQEFSRRFPSVRADRLHLMRHGVEKTPRMPAGGERDGVIVAARLVEKKGILLLLRALGRLGKCRTDLRVTIYGEGPEEWRLRRAIVEEDLTDRVEIHRFVPCEDLLAKMEGAAVFMHPSVRAEDGDVDGIPNAVLEAMTVGTPVVAGRIPALEGVFKDGRDIAFVDPHDADGVARRLEELLDSPALGRRLAEEARRTVSVLFNADKNITPLASLFRAKQRKRLRVLHVLEATVGGTRKHLRLLMEALPADKYELSVACATRRCADFSRDMELFASMGVRVHVVDMVRSISPIADLKAAISLARLMMVNRYDIVHCHSSKAGLVGRLAAWMVGCRGVVYSPHSFAFQGERNPLQRRFYALAERVLGRMTRRLIAVSAAEVDAARAERIMMNPSDVVLAPNALPSSSVSVAPRCGSVQTVAFLGRLEPQKGCDTFLKACAKLNGHLDGRAVIVAGAGSLAQELKVFHGRLGLDKKVRFVGEVTDSDAFYKGVDLLVMPSLWEGNPYTVHEAVHHGIPVLASDIPAHCELLGRNSPCLFRTGDADDLAHKIAHAIRDPERLHNAVDRREFLATHRLDDQIACLMRTYDEVIAELDGAVAAGATAERPREAYSNVREARHVPTKVSSDVGPRLADLHVDELSLTPSDASLERDVKPLRSGTALPASVR